MIATMFRRHPLLGVHLVIVLLLLIGLFQRTGLTYAAGMAGYVAMLIAGYVLFDRWFRRVSWEARPRTDPRTLAIVVLLGTIATAIAHWTVLGQVPLIAALMQKDDLVVQGIRLHMTLDMPTWLNYLSNFMIKALIPFTLVVTFGRRPLLFAVLAIAGGLYALSLVQKSYIITLFVPLWIAFLLARRWRAFAALTAAFILVTGLLLMVAQPEKLVQAKADDPGNEAVLDEGVKEHGLAVDLLRSVFRRVVLMPGWTVAAWFQHIPSDVPFQHGSAVRPIAFALGRQFNAVDRKIYDLEYPEYAMKGTQGTVGSASFMYGWANFGWFGLLLSGIITAAVLRSFTLLFGSRWRWALCLNTFPLLVLSSTALPTVLLTHGWVLTLALFLLFAPPHEPLQ